MIVRSFLGALLGLGLACSTPEERDKDEAFARALDVLDLYRSWDHARAARVFHDQPDDGRSWQYATLTWLATQLHTCGPPEPIPARFTGSNGRFRYTCTDGALEIELWIEGGRIKKSFIGGRGIHPPAPVRAAAQEVVSAMPLTEPERVRLGLRPVFTTEAMLALGRCQLADLDIGGRTLGVWGIECEGGEGRLKVKVDNRGERVQATFFRALEDVHSFPPRSS